MLMAIPCKSEDAETTIACLATLFKWYGPPLIVKSDKMKDYLEKQNVLQLFSPRGTPSYNGSVEAGVGSLKTRAVFEAVRNARLRGLAPTKIGGDAVHHPAKFGFAKCLYPLSAWAGHCIRVGRTSFTRDPHCIHVIGKAKGVES